MQVKRLENAPHVVNHVGVVSDHVRQGVCSMADQMSNCRIAATRYAGGGTYRLSVLKHCTNIWSLLQLIVENSPVVL